METPMLVRLKPFVRGLLSFLPGANFLLPRRKVGTVSDPRSCYDIWLKHITLAWRSGWTEIPKTLVELGPGDSLGVGFAALLTGAEHYIGLDILKNADTKSSLRLFDALVELFKNRTGRPQTDWPDYDDFLDSRRFPHRILTEKRLAVCLAQDRIDRIREHVAALARGRKDTGMLRYVFPWKDSNLPENSVDMVLSHAVLEHVENLDMAYRRMHVWLRRGGLMSHDIDLRCHGLSSVWNGHWAIPELLWKMIAGRRAFLINRRPCSDYVDLTRRHGFEIVAVYKETLPGIARSQLAPRWKHLSDDDLCCSKAFLLAVKP